MSDSDGICNKDAVCVKIEVRGTRGWYMKRDETCRMHCLSVDNDAACYVGIVMMEVINLADISE
jgi:hypothetical protein